MDRSGQEGRKAWASLVRRVCIALAVLLLAGVYTRYFMFQEITLPETPLQEFPYKLGEWETAEGHALSREVLDILKVDDYVFREFTRGNGMVSLYIAYYRTHRRFAEIHTPENCQVGGGWEVLGEKRRTLEVTGVNGGKVHFVEALYEKDRIKQVYLYWYQVKGSYLTNFFSYKLNVIMNSLLYHRSDAAFVRITVPLMNDDVDNAVMVGEKFLMDALPFINNIIPE